MTDRGPDSSALAPAGSRAEHGTAGPGTAAKRAAPVVCHCRQVTYGAVEEVIEAGLATSLPELQRRTTACTRCFGCRFELELMLEDRLGPGFERSEIVTLPVEDPPAPSRWAGLRRRILGRPADPAAGSGPLPRRMYMPVLEGYRGHEVRTRAILFNSWGAPTPQKTTPRPSPASSRTSQALRDNGDTTSRGCSGRWCLRA